MVVSLLFLAILSFSCQTAEDDGPGPVIPQEELPTILADMLTLEAAVKELPNSTRDSLSTVYYNRALRPHGYQLEDFQQSMQWLQEDPARLQAAYEEALEILTTREAELKGN